MKRGRVLKSFNDSFHRARAEEGDEIDIPITADWVQAGLVELIGPPAKITKREAAVQVETETAVLPEVVTRSGRRKGPQDGSKEK